MQAQRRSKASAERPSRWILVRRPSLASGLFLAMIGAIGARAQVQPPPRPPGAFQRPGQVALADPAELSAYQTALAEQNPGDRVSALQGFLLAYPNSGMRRAAIAELMAAQRQMRDGQTVEAPAGGTMQPVAPVPAASPVAQPVEIPRDSLLQQAPKQARITVAPHGLSILADNSALSEILREISVATGMKVEGLSRDERVFGTYGPGEARQVLLTLLEGSGYNVLMIGDLASGAPRELSLSQRAVAASGNSVASSRNPAEEDAEDDQDVQQTPVPEPQPVQQTQPAGQDNGQPQPPRSPQEILQELQRLRQQNQNPNLPPQGPQP